MTQPTVLVTPAQFIITLTSTNPAERESFAEFCNLLVAKLRETAPSLPWATALVSQASRPAALRFEVELPAPRAVSLPAATRAVAAASVVLGLVPNRGGEVLH